MTLHPDQFIDFYVALYGHEPFPWQQMLAPRVVSEGWPECLDLPTASGKTACIDIAVFALACQANGSLAERTAARRIFFVVDRRIVVDSAYDRASKLAKQLREAKEGVLREVADRLRSLHDGRQPLMAARIRGGITRDDGWIRSPAQPTIITGTVDQVGSRLLFRAYGSSHLTAPIHAAMVANDSLIILDEAHCAVPFLQTIKAVERYRVPDWVPHPISASFRVVVMSATPPAADMRVFPDAAERSVALDHPTLNTRRGSKLAELAVARRPSAPKKDDAGLRGAPLTEDELVLDIADRVIRSAATGAQRIVVMVNRVVTARAVHNQLFAERTLAVDALDADLVLMTGRMRSIDRDEIVERWGDILQAKEAQSPLSRPVIVVTTQCLEVGADFSFDALITECASFDALRQRFGRVDRFGTIGSAEGSVLIRADQAKTQEQIEKLEKDGKNEDPIYGYALTRTWNWLNAHLASAGSNREKRFDFGIDAVDAVLPNGTIERRVLLDQLLAPAPNAPVMLPAHVDCWTQTAPRPKPDPDIATFLHGPARGEPEVYVVLRADLILDRRDLWLEAVSLCPPTSLEAFSVPLHVIRRWLAGQMEADGGGDVEGTSIVQEDASIAEGHRSVVLWRGLKKAGQNSSAVTSNPIQVRPYDLVVLSTSDEQAKALGDLPRELGEEPVFDVGDRAFQRARSRPMLRLHRLVLRPWTRHPAVAALLEWAEGKETEEDEDDLSILLAGLADATDVIAPERDTKVPAPPPWMRTAARALQVRKSREVMKHPCGGYVLTSHAQISDDKHAEEEASADDDDLTSDSNNPILLRDHLDAVAEVTRGFARHCLPQQLAGTIVRAAELHDLGKADWRFQVMLNKGNEIEAFGRGQFLAKSDQVPRSLAARQRAQSLARLPEGFRHELLSLQIAIAVRQFADGTDPDLLFHLIASHHGHGRPFAPIVSDDDPPDLDLSDLGLSGRLSREERLGMVPAHHVDSGIGERFWRLTRRYGWWGLAYIEAILRLADWEASNRHKVLVKAETAPAEGVA